MIGLKDFQNQAVTELVKKTRGLLNTDGNNKQLIFKSPTGSGKTIMMADLLARLAKETLNDDYVYMWISVNDLHSQSKSKIAKYLDASPYSFMLLEEMQNVGLKQNTILFANWHSLTTKAKGSDNEETRDWGNQFVRDREDGRSLVNVLDKTREDGLQLVLIVDESHRNYMSIQTQEFINEVIQPKLIVEVSATPQFEYNPDLIQAKQQDYYKVDFASVVESGLIKQQTVVNQSDEIQNSAKIATADDEVVILASLEKRQALAKQYKNTGTNINPLVLIQLPSKASKMDSLDKSVKETVEDILFKQGITYENGKLAIWTSEDKKNLVNIEKNFSEVEVLIFKQAVATGWDCPRAQVLCMLREIKSLTFKIQTIGRIIRMPEAKHYAYPELNSAYLYTNIEEFEYDKDDSDALNYFASYPTEIKEGIDLVNLPSVYLHRLDYGDLTRDFSDIFKAEFKARFGIIDGDIFGEAYEKLDKHLELYPDELKTPILTDLILTNIDEIEEELGHQESTDIKLNISDKVMNTKFDMICKIWCLPYAPARSMHFVKKPLLDLFMKVVGITSFEEIHRIVACSEVNQNILGEIIKTAKEKFELKKKDIISHKRATDDVIFNIPSKDYYSENYEVIEANKYALKSCYLQKGRSTPEKALEAHLEANMAVKWWYKNGEKKNEYFAVAYEGFDTTKGISKLSAFYPDYIAMLNDGTICILETKSGQTANSQDTKQKAEALGAYVARLRGDGIRIMSGIVNAHSTGLRINSDFEYDTKKPILEWDMLDL